MARAPRDSRRPERRPVETSPAPAGARRWQPALLGLWALVLFPPFLFDPDLTDNFRLPKESASEVAALLSIALLGWRLVEWWRERRADGVDGWRRWLAEPVVQAVLPLLVLATLTVLTAEQTARVTQALPSLWIGCAALVVWSLTVTSTERRRLLLGVTAVATLIAFFGILQFHRLFDPFRFDEVLTDRLAMTSLAGGAFDLAGYLLIPILFAQAGLSEATTPRRRAIWLAVLAVLGYALALSQTLTVAVAVAISSFLFWFFQVGRRRLLMVAGAVLVVGLAAVAAIAPLRTRVGLVGEDLVAGRWNEVLSGRLDGWRAAGWMMGEHPLVGVGHGAYRGHFGDAKLALVAEGVEFFPFHRSSYFINAHNDLLEAGAEWGIPGLLAVLWAGWLLARKLKIRWTAGEGSSGPPAVRGFEVAALAAMVVVALGNFPFHVALIAWPWLLVLSGLFARDEVNS